MDNKDVYYLVFSNTRSTAYDGVEKYKLLEMFKEENYNEYFKKYSYKSCYFIKSTAIVGLYNIAYGNYTWFDLIKNNKTVANLYLFEHILGRWKINLSLVNLLEVQWNKLFNNYLKIIENEYSLNQQIFDQFDIKEIERWFYINHPEVNFFKIISAIDQTINVHMLDKYYFENINILDALKKIDIIDQISYNQIFIDFDLKKEASILDILIKLAKIRAKTFLLYKHYYIKENIKEDFFKLTNLKEILEFKI